MAMGYTSKIIGQVHDSLIFDAIRSEVLSIAKLCTDVMRDLPKYVKQVWGIDFNVPLGGEIELGENYGHMTEYSRDELKQFINGGS
jgi:DNA polymerase I-like protein with 3'-5' exonuclease and polymerase domains